MASARTKKASDVWRESYHPFHRAISFGEAFPTIESLIVEVHETDGCSQNRSTFLDEFTAEEFLDCGNPRCYRGGFRLGRILRRMVTSGEAEWAGTAFCRGHEGSPNGKRLDRPCDRHLSIKIKIKFHVSTPITAHATRNMDSNES